MNPTKRRKLQFFAVFVLVWVAISVVLWVLDPGWVDRADLGTFTLGSLTGFVILAIVLFGFGVDLPGRHRGS